MMKEHNIYVFSLPSHSTHHLQPADKALFKSLMHHWRKAGRTLTVKSGGKRLDRVLFMPLFAKAWKEAATPKNAHAGFRGSGFFPFNPRKIKKSLFIPSETTERPLADNTAGQDTADRDSSDGGSSDSSLQDFQGYTSHPLHDAVQPSTSSPSHSQPAPL